MIKVRRRPTPERDLPPGYQHGYWPHQDVVVHTINGEVVGGTPRTVRPWSLVPLLPAARRELARVLNWNVIEGDHDL